MYCLQDLCTSQMYALVSGDNGYGNDDGTDTNFDDDVNSTFPVQLPSSQSTFTTQCHHLILSS